MDIRFRHHNSHLEAPDHFRNLDPQLRAIQGLVFQHRPELLQRLPQDRPGIYILGGGRQVGKTTLLKLWMADLLDEGIAPASIRYYSGELIDDYHSLLHIIEEAVGEMPADDSGWLILDEISYIRGWDRAIKYAADAGLLENIHLLITGSDLALMRTARANFPGRRGGNEIVDFHLRPLSFCEAFVLEHGEELRAEALDAAAPESSPAVDIVFEAFDRYLMHGGFLTAMNDIAQDGRIHRATLATYSDWIRGDVLKRGKSEHYLREILAALLRRMGSQLTWNSLARELSIDHPKTVADYMELLGLMDAVFIQPALVEDRLLGAPKKARKLMFFDPFIHHAVRAWIEPVSDPFTQQIQPAVKDTEQSSRLVEAVAVTHAARFWPTYYIKAEGEVDLACIAGDRFWPIEIKWSKTIRPKDLKQLAKYPTGRILGRSKRVSEVLGLPAIPLPLALLVADGAGVPFAAPVSRPDSNL